MKGNRISGQGHEDSVLLTGPYNLPAGDDISGVGVEYDLEKDSGIVGGSSGDIVLKMFIKAGKVQLMINEMVQGILEGAGKNLLGKMNGNEFPLSVGVRFITSHAAISL